MGEPHAAFALKRKRDEICGVIAHYERLLREAQHDLAHVNASLRLFEATGEAAEGAGLAREEEVLGHILISVINITNIGTKYTVVN